MVSSLCSRRNSKKIELEDFLSDFAIIICSKAHQETLLFTVEETASYVDIQYRSNTFNRMLSIKLKRFPSNAFIKCSQPNSIERFQSNAFNRTLSIERFQLNAFNQTLSIKRFQSNAFDIYWMSSQLAISSTVHRGTFCRFCRCPVK